MKDLSSRQLSPLIAIALTVVGIVMALAAFIDMLVLPMPYAPQDREWLLGFTTQIVDRGIIPLLGLALFLAGFWVKSLTASVKRLWPTIAVILSCVLSAFYLLLIVLHISNVAAVQSNQLEAIAERTAQAEQEIETQIDTQIGQRRTLITQLLDNPELRDQAVSRGLISQEDAAVLEEFEDDPEQLETYLQGLESQAADVRSGQQSEISDQRETRIDEIKSDALKSNLRIGLSSVLLTIGYGVLGWSGLRWFRRKD
ncbi:MAG: HpsJ family protein [Cyanobacteria bacterium P01_A01_bin.135]